MDYTNTVSLRVYTAGQMKDTVDAGARLREQEPRHGDYIVVRCHPSRTVALEKALRSQLAPFGAGFGVDDER